MTHTVQNFLGTKQGRVKDSQAMSSHTVRVCAVLPSRLQLFPFDDERIGYYAFRCIQIFKILQDFSSHQIF